MTRIGTLSLPVLCVRGLRLGIGLVLAGVLVACFAASAAPAKAATFTYHTGILTPYQQTSVSIGSMILNYTRMSTQHPRPVRAGVTTGGGGGLAWTDPDYFVQNPNPLGNYYATAYCRNDSPVNVSGYCAWYN